MQPLHITIIKKKGGRRYNMNILSSDLCIFKIIVLFAFVFLLFVFFYCYIYFIQDDIFNFCKTSIYPSRYYVEKNPK